MIIHADVLHKWLRSERVIPVKHGRTCLLAWRGAWPWTPTSGNVLNIESTPLLGNHELTLTDQSDDVLQESPYGAILGSL